MDQSFAETIKRLRNERGLSQGQLAEQMFVTRSTVARWEAGSRMPDAMMIMRLAKCLAVSTEMLFNLLPDKEEAFNIIMVDDEKIILQGGLLVKIDTPVTSFRVPPLTLQPIVENVVKHGLDPELEPLFISVCTRRQDDCVEVIVEDSGPGFRPADDNEPHTPLENIRQRLKMMCGGELMIDERDGGGTAVRLRIPA